MEIGIHALLMSQYYVPRIADLVLRVPTEKPGNDFFQTHLIGSLVHGCQMSRNCRHDEAKEMMYLVTEHLFSSAQPDNFAIQDQAHMIIVGMVSHASLMGTTTTEGLAEMLSAARPLVDEPLPVTQQGLDRLNERLELARRKIGDISHRVLMERSRQNIARSMGRGS